MKSAANLIVSCFALILISWIAPRAGAAVIPLDSTLSPFGVFISYHPGTTSDAWTFGAEARMDTPLTGLAANQSYHVTLHMPTNTAFRLDPATADLSVILYSQNRSASNVSPTVVATNIGTVQFVGQNVTGIAPSLNLRNESAGGTTVVGESLASDATTYAQAKVDPSQRALVTDVVLDFTLPANFNPDAQGQPLQLVALQLAATELLPPGGSATQPPPAIAGFVVPEPMALAPVLLAGLMLRRRHRARDCRPTA
jgi:hypothetical protein